MEPKVEEDIISGLAEAYDALSKFDIAKLNKVSNLTIHNSGIFQDPHSVAFAIMVYSLAKVCSKERERDYKDWKKFKDNMLGLIKDAQMDIRNGKHKSYDRDIKKIFKIINSMDKKLTLYATEVVKQAKLKKGTKVYEHGISSGRVAELMGVSEWDLQSYMGISGIKERVWSRKPVAERLKTAKKMFNLK